jgi:hypothetical protein
LKGHRALPDTPSLCSIDSILEDHRQDSKPNHALRVERVRAAAGDAASSTDALQKFFFVLEAHAPKPSAHAQLPVPLPQLRRHAERFAGTKPQQRALAGCTRALEPILVKKLDMELNMAHVQSLPHEARVVIAKPAPSHEAAYQTQAWGSRTGHCSNAAAEEGSVNDASAMHSERSSRPQLSEASDALKEARRQRDATFLTSTTSEAQVLVDHSKYITRMRGAQLTQEETSEAMERYATFHKIVVCKRERVQRAASSANSYTYTVRRAPASAVRAVCVPSKRTPVGE